MHQITFTTQEAFRKPIDHENDSEDKHGHQKSHKGKQEQVRFCVDIAIRSPKHNEPVHQGQHQRRTPDQGELLPHGPEVIF